MGFLALGMTQALEAYLLFTVVRRMGEYAISKPVREVLFTVVSGEEKYKAKNFIDTAVSREGDASTGWAVSGVKALGVLRHSWRGCWFRQCFSGDGSGGSLRAARPACNAHNDPSPSPRLCPSENHVL